MSALSEDERGTEFSEDEHGTQEPQVRISGCVFLPLVAVAVCRLQWA